MIEWIYRLRRWTGSLIVGQGEEWITSEVHNQCYCGELYGMHWFNAYIIRTAPPCSNSFMQIVLTRNRCMLQDPIRSRLCCYYQHHLTCFSGSEMLGHQSLVHVRIRRHVKRARIRMDAETDTIMTWGPFVPNYWVSHNRRTGFFCLSECRNRNGRIWSWDGPDA
jgi:hypothetical protein